MRLKNKVALITGGANGIGLATAQRFAKEGAKIILWDLSENGKMVVEDLKKQGYEAIFSKISVADQELVLQGVSEAHKHFGRIDILINNAGITKDRTLLKMSKQEWDDVISVNLTGVFNCTQAVVPIMKEQNYGRIVSASSNVAIRGNYGQTNYVATKSAIIGMTKVWALELGRFGITANCIAPGFIQTAMTDAMPEEVRKQSLAHIPVGKWGLPEDIANGYLYLASDEASFVSGICLTIDGGAAR
ncbi:MAG: beta-ketoacyl-ACP reductase [Cytophagales bacterium]|jgi:3-oxoacyl-[acyl-carrier protein] reductase|nr:beta-ketoacyl-ACP reductase [Cytophagales bacterium]MCA6389146.1 beta-ketoacyl-ACP reductase [Cytophagales bacterium]MCA6391996.1 beta-ketoacyl-ACP reductase [Cytophagales bacterium]MCA6396188.1 beta-ketoacyl-ACP reductase [Cytophagales bacterium]MCA6398283.1 beta-ketoacyl-ACP reductase [Cytophagales bacterium]